MGVSLDEFAKALDSLAEVLRLHADASASEVYRKAFRDAAIQRFEYGIELSWKLSMKVLGSATAAAKPAVREMARSNLIDDSNRWIDFIEARNNSSHSYDEEVAKRVFAQVEAFLPLARKLFAELTKIAK